MIRNRAERDKERHKFTRRKFLGTGLTIAGAAMLAPKTAFASDPDYTIVMVPDTQYMALSCGQAFTNMMTWVSNNLTTSQGGVFTCNIKAVLGVGDCAHNATGAEYTKGQTAYTVLSNAGVPWVNPPGNHDYDNSLNNRSTGLGVGFKTGGYFAGDQRAPVSSGGVGVYGSLPTGGTSSWGGYYDSANYYIRLTIGSRKILVFSVEFQPRAAVLTWAKGIHDTNHSYECIICTHSFIGCAGSLMRYTGESGYVSGSDGNGDNSQFGLGTAQATSDASFNSGYGMWSSYLTSWPRLTMVLNGHDYFEFQSAPAYHYRNLELTSTSPRAQKVQSIFSNFQQWDQPSTNYDGRASQGSNAGQPATNNQYCTALGSTYRIGHLMLLQFRPSAGVMDAYCISTNSGNWEQAYASRASAPDTTPHLLFTVPYTGVPANVFPLPNALG